MGALIPVGRIATKRQQGAPNIMPGSDGRMGIAEVITEHVTAHRQFIIAGQAQQVPRQVIVIRPARILHCHAHRVLAGVLARRYWGNINPDKLAHIPRQCGGRATARFFGDGEQRMTVDQRLLATVHNGLQCGKQCCHPGLVVQMPRADMAAFGEFRQRIKCHVVADIDPQGIAVGPGRAICIQTQLDVVPTDRQLIHPGIEGMA